MKETKYAGTQTEKNLMAAFAGESEARNKYTYFASKAKKEGYEQIAALFLKTAENEKEHANSGVCFINFFQSTQVRSWNPYFFQVHLWLLHNMIF